MSNSFFDIYKIEKLISESFDLRINTPENADRIVCVFFWGHDCPNCEIAKKILIDRKAEVDTLNVIWYHANIYEDFDLATRFGLFGIPVFLFFKNGKKLGKISPFPGFEPFYEAVSQLR